MRPRALWLLFCAGAAAPASPALAQCSDQIQTDLVSGFRAIGNPAVSQQQNPANGWIFTRGSPGGQFLTGVLIGGNPNGAWGSPGQPFSIPLAGPIASPDPNQNQVFAYDRSPSMTGLFMHPGVNSSLDCYAVLAPQAPITIHSASLNAEVFGDLSDGVILGVSQDTGSGIANLIAPTFLPFTPAGHISLPAIGLPLPVNPGQHVWLRVNLNNAPSEDWCNANLTLNLSGGPLIIAQPQDRGFCTATATSTRVTAVGSGALSYRWRREDVPGSGVFNEIHDGPGRGVGSIIWGTSTPELRILRASALDAARYDCVITGCTTVTSTPATLTTCPADFNCDTFVDFFDIDAFTEAFEDADPRADFNADGFTDFFDYDAYIGAFESGC